MFSLIFSQAQFISSLSSKFSKAASLFLILTCYCSLTSASLETSIKASIKHTEIVEQKTLIAQVSLELCQKAVDFAGTNLEINSIDYTKTQELNKENIASKKAFDGSKVSFTKTKTDYTQAKLNLQIAQQNVLLLALQ